MTNRDNPCILCGSIQENFDEDYCSQDCYEKDDTKGDKK